MSNLEDFERFFPDVDHGIDPLGGQILVMGKFVASKTESGLILTNDTRAQETHDVQIGRVVAIGPLAFKNKDTMEPWKEGNWCEVGDFVFVPRVGTRISPIVNGERYNYVMLSDTQIQAKLTRLDGFSQFSFL